MSEYFAVLFNQESFGIEPRVQRNHDIQDEYKEREKFEEQFECDVAMKSDGQVKSDIQWYEIDVHDVEN